MANVSFKKGLLESLPSTYSEGTFYVTTDERAIYLDTSSTSRIRIGDFQEYATLAALQAVAAPSTTALYYVTELNVLAKWDGSSYIQINPDTDTGATSVAVSGEGNAVTAVSYDSGTRELTVTLGETFATSSELATAVSDLEDYVAEKTSGIATDASLAELESRVTTAEGEIDDLQALTGTIPSTAASTDLVSYIAEVAASTESSANTYTDEQIAANAYDDTSVVSRISALEDVGAEANVLEGVQVNGTALTITDKIVNLLVETGSANGTISVNGTDISVAGLGSLAYLSEVSDSELSAALAATIAAKAEASDLTALQTLVGSLPSDATSTTVVDYIAEAIAEIVAGADESYDTLKEIADWISSHADSAATMNSQISDNTDAIEALAALVGTLPTDATSTTVVDYVSEAIDDAALTWGEF